jgi:predicted acetyltransferase
MPIDVRAIDASELDAMIAADQRGFGAVMTNTSRSWAEAELDRTRVAFDDGAIVGVSRTYSFDITVPGGALVPAAAVSWVSVVPTHRRRGILTRMMGAMHDDARERGEPVAILTASESSIYGRFGYGVAAWRLGITAPRAHVDFASDLGTSGSMRMLSRSDAEVVVPRIYDDARRLRAGMVTRPDFWWPTVFWGFSEGPGKAFFVAVHTDASGRDDGYVAYEIEGDWAGGVPDRRLLIWDMQSTNDEARAALWRFAFGVDLIGKVTATNVPVDDPLRHLVRDGRRVRTDFVNDGLWVAPLDPAAFLAARRYAIEGHVAIQVHAVDGSVSTFALDGSERDAKCVATGESPDLVCASRTLGACSLGGTKWSELAQAGLVEERTAGALVRADAMFATRPAPAMVGYF